MFSLFNKKPSEKAKLQSHQLELQGMHCTSCALNIDMTLEDINGVKSVSTHYAKSQTTVEFDPEVASLDEIIQGIEALGYTVKR